MTAGATKQGREGGGLSARDSQSSPTLRGHWLLLARAAWMAVALATLGAFVTAVPARYAQLAHSTEAVRTALADMGLSAGTYAFYNVAHDTLFMSHTPTASALGRPSSRKEANSPKCLEEVFCELRLYGALGSPCGD
jgi:hypothetical protein